MIQEPPFAVAGGLSDESIDDKNHSQRELNPYSDLPIVRPLVV